MASSPSQGKKREKMDAHRVEELLKLSIRPADIAFRCGVHRSTVSRYLTKMRLHAIEATTPQRKPGRPCTLKKFLSAFRENLFRKPDRIWGGSNNSLWTLTLLMEIWGEDRNGEMIPGAEKISRSQLENYLRELGIKPANPWRTHAIRDQLPRILQQQKELESSSSPGRTALFWVGVRKIGCPPGGPREAEKSPNAPFYVAYAISRKGVFRFLLYRKPPTGTVFANFIQRLLVCEAQPLLLVWLPGKRIDRKPVEILALQNPTACHIITLRK